MILATSLARKKTPNSMEIKSILTDEKVSAASVLIEISIGDYLALAKEIYKKNPLQRKRVRSSKTVYSLLKSDILDGCVIPPVVLAYTKPVGTLTKDLAGALQRDSEHFVLLDGLQRSMTLMEIEAETVDSPEVHAKFMNTIIRCEIYEGINKLGILYRMLTLNTGQTPMSVRHQVEIMYQDLLEAGVDGITLVREADARRARQPNSYNFKDVIEGLNSYLERSESPLDRSDVLENIASLQNLAKENAHRDVFRDFLTAWDAFIGKVISFDIRYPGVEPSEDESDEEVARVWGTTGVQMFKRAQAISGFGAAIGLLKDEDDSLSFENLNIDAIEIGQEPEEFIVELNESMDRITSKARRIGNAQRLFFRQFFKMLFWQDSGCYLNMSLANKEAYRSTLRIGI